MCDMTEADVWHDSNTCVIWHLYSSLHLEWHFFNLKSQSIISFSRSLLPSSVEKSDMTQTHVWYDTCTCGTNSIRCVTWLNKVCDMTQSDVWHDSIRCVTWLNTTCYMMLDEIRCVPWLNQMCAVTQSDVCHMTQSDVWHDSRRPVTWCYTNHLRRAPVWKLNVRHDSTKCVPWLNRTRVMTQSDVCRDSCTCDKKQASFDSHLDRGFEKEYRLLVWQKLGLFTGFLSKAPYHLSKTPSLVSLYLVLVSLSLCVPLSPFLSCLFVSLSLCHVVSLSLAPIFETCTYYSVIFVKRAVLSVKRALSSQKIPIFDMYTCLSDTGVRSGCSFEWAHHLFFGSVLSEPSLSPLFGCTCLWLQLVGSWKL